VALSTVTLVQEFERHLIQLDLAPATIRSYSADVRGFLRWSNRPANRDVAQIPRASELGRYREHLIEASNQSPATVNRRLQALRIFGRFLQEQGLSASNPARSLMLLANGHAQVEPRVLDTGEIAQLIVTVRASARRSLMRRDYAIIELMLQAGLRVNEVALLKKDDLVLTQNGIRLAVRGTAEHHSRQVPVNEVLARALREYLQMRPRVPGVNALFISQQGRPLSTRSIQRLVEEHARTAELEDVCANSLRHTCAKRLLHENHTPEAVAKWLGHKSVESLNRYR
jgi:integrase/recombinase XerC